MKRFSGPDGGSINTRPIRQPEPRVQAPVSEKLRQSKSVNAAFTNSSFGDYDRNARQVSGEIVALKFLATKNGLRGLL